MYYRKISHQLEPSLNLQRGPRPKYQVHWHCASPKDDNTNQRHWTQVSLHILDDWKLAESWQYRQLWSDPLALSFHATEEQSSLFKKV